jgi:hypothetical protein
MTTLWQRYESHREAPPAPNPEVQAHLSGLEKEVETLRALLRSRDDELASRDIFISEERSVNARLKKEVFEANEHYTRFVAGLSAELDRADQLESHLRAVRNECSEACKNAESRKGET